MLDRTAEMDAAYSNPDKDKRGVWKATPLHAKSGSRNYVAKFSSGVEWTAPQGRYPRYSETKIQELYEDNRIHFGKVGTTPSVKTFLSEVKQGKTVGSIWSFDKVGSSHQANEQIAQVFGKGIFENPKPTGLIKTCIKTANAEGEIILDFFGGSGTTGQAVMELNEADGGNRKFILVQLPERTDEKSEAYKAGYKLISDITVERNKRVVNRIIEQKRHAHPNLFVNNEGKDALKNLGFKVFKLEKSYFPRTEWTPNPDASEAEKVQSLKDYIAAKESQLRIDFDRDKLLTEILLKEGFKLNYIVKPYEAVTTNEILHISDTDKEALICLENTIETETAEHFKTHKDLKFICLERGLDTTKKWNLANSLGEKFRAI